MFQVAVADTDMRMVMTVVNGPQDLDHSNSCLIFGKSGASQQPLSERTARAVLHHQDQGILLTINPKQSCYVGMVHLQVDVHLLEDVLQVFFAHSTPRYKLHSYRLCSGCQSIKMERLAQVIVCFCSRRGVSVCILCQSQEHLPASTASDTIRCHLILVVEVSAGWHSSRHTNRMRYFGTVVMKFTRRPHASTLDPRTSSQVPKEAHPTCL
mmetsp:Transcript_29601/g.78363  ORF Transcript_29601/g.78363 Transcript_29601/m.78363 type:complete len:211 (+) Transcript_29601:1365-1997(+)